MDLEALRARIDEILATLEGDGLTTLSDDELITARDELRQLFDTARELGGQDGLAEAQRCLDGHNSIRSQLAERAETEARTAESFEAMAAEFEAQGGEGDPEVDAEGDAEGEQPEVPAEDPEPEAAPEVPEAAETIAVEVVEDEPTEERVLVPAGQTATVTAGVRPASTPRTPARAGAPLARTAAARQTTRQTAGPAVAKRHELTAKIRINEEGGITPKSRRELTEAFGRAHERYQNVQAGMGMQIPVIHLEYDYPESHDLRPVAAAPDRVTQMLEAQLSTQSLQAAGGICAPFPVDYSLLNIASDERPVRAALPTFQAARGGIQFMPSYVLSDVLTAQSGAAVNQYTLSNDVAGNVTKQCQTFSCKSVQTANVYAITRCVQFGNWNARFYPELIDNIMSQVAAVQARYAEQLLLTAIGAGSTQVDFNGVSWSGATPSLLAGIARAVQRLRHANRAASAPIRVALPNWVRDLIREDMSLRLAHERAQFEVDDAWVDAQIRRRGADPWYFIDGENDIQGMYATQAQGPLSDWPNEVVFYVYFEGAWTLLDGGTLDLGLVRDSTLNLANNFQMFAETWEGVFSRGLPSLRVNATICANGASAGTYAPENCVS